MRHSRMNYARQARHNLNMHTKALGAFGAVFVLLILKALNVL
jgi:hypothetical protein